PAIFHRKCGSAPLGLARPPLQRTPAGWRRSGLGAAGGAGQLHDRLRPRCRYRDGEGRRSEGGLPAGAVDRLHRPALRRRGRYALAGFSALRETGHLVLAARSGLGQAALSGDGRRRAAIRLQARTAPRPDEPPVSRALRAGDRRRGAAPGPRRPGSLGAAPTPPSPASGRGSLRRFSPRENRRQSLPFAATAPRRPNGLFRRSRALRSSFWPPAKAFG